MRCWLSSYRQGARADMLQTLVSGPRGHEVAVVANALDGNPHRGQVLERETDALSRLDFRVAELDLRHFSVATRALLARRLEEIGMVWITGGNAFVLARIMQLSGFAALVKELLEQDQIVYGGYSAGACVAGPDLEGIEVMDDPSFVPEGLGAELPASGLGLVPFRVIPHWRSQHPETEAADRAVAELERRGLAFQALRDGQAIMINGEVRETVG